MKKNCFKELKPTKDHGAQEVYPYFSCHEKTVNVDLPRHVDMKINLIFRVSRRQNRANLCNPLIFEIYLHFLLWFLVSIFSFTRLPTSMTLGSLSSLIIFYLEVFSNLKEIETFALKQDSHLLERWGNSRTELVTHVYETRTTDWKIEINKQTRRQALPPQITELLEDFRKKPQ